MNITLASMPWNLLETPSLPIGILRARAQSADPSCTVTDYYGNLRWAEYLLERSDGSITVPDYDYIANWGIWHGMGDWVFAGALYDAPDWHLADYQAYLDSQQVDAGKCFAMRQYAQEFVTGAAEEILARGPALVGFSSTFQQNAASLAVARQIKRLRPDLPVVFGGGNCDHPMGAALHRTFGFVDYVVSGEGEIAFTGLLAALRGERQLSSVPGLCWRRPDGHTVANGAAGMVPISEVPAPDYTAWFAALERSPLRDEVAPRLLFESARGCWWGEKHQCTFCGLNGSTMTFRSRSPDDAWAALRDLVVAHQVLDVVLVDNIMDPGYLAGLLPRLAATGWDLRLYCEVKANLRADQLAQLSRAGVSHIQPGIENLSTRVLHLMDKGVHATQNVQVLRDCEDSQLTVDWNYLYGFPGESDGDYQSVVGQLPALVHLQPPSGATRIILERFSPYFERPELGFARRQPAAFYPYIYDLPPEQLGDIVYQFAAPPRGIAGPAEQALRSAVARWRDNYLTSSLVGRVADGVVYLHDRRAGWPARTVALEDPRWAAAYLSLTTPRSLPGLLRELAGRGFPVAAPDLRSWLAWARESGLVFEDGGRVVALATTRPPVRARSRAGSADDLAG